MRQFEGFTNKHLLAFSHDNTWKTVTMPWLDDDAVAVTVEFMIPEDPSPPTLPCICGARPVGTTLPDDVFEHEVGGFTYQTQMCTVNGTKQIQVKAQGDRPGMTFAVTDQWGGDAVRSLGPDWPRAPALSEPDDGIYREVDLTSHIAVEDRGNVRAVICHLYHSPNSAGGDSADARGVGSAWNITSGYIAEGFREETIVPVDDDDIIEVRESGYAAKYDPWSQASYVYFVGYILRGSFDEGSGEHYQYRSILDPVDDDVGIAAWQTYDVEPVTSARVHSIFWRWQSCGFGVEPHYTREVGSTDAAPDQTESWRIVTAKAIEVDGSKEVEHFLHAVDLSWVLGYLDALGTLPGQATDPDPFDTETEVSITKVLGWTAGAGALSHDVYFGTDPSPDAGEFRGNQPGTTFNPGTLTPGTTYFWRIDEVNLAGTTTGIVWSFTVEAVCIAAEPSAFARVRGITSTPARVSAAPATSERVSGVTSTPERLAATPAIRERVSAVSSTPERLSAAANIAERVGAVTSTPERLSAAPAVSARVGGVTSTPERVSATPSTRRRITAAASICGEGVNMKANTTCPDELPWNATVVLDLDDVLDDLTDPGTPITSADSVTCSLYDVEEDDELTVSPVTLDQVGSDNHWRKPIDVTGANGFARRQRIRAVYHFDGGALLLGEFESLGVVVAAVN